MGKLSAVASISDATRTKRLEDARRVREIADQIERGDVIEFSLVVNNVVDNCFVSIGNFEDRWRMLGALEYAKHCLHDH